MVDLTVPTAVEEPALAPGRSTIRLPAAKLGSLSAHDLRPLGWITVKSRRVATHAGSRFAPRSPAESPELGDRPKPPVEPRPGSSTGVTDEAGRLMRPASCPYIAQTSRAATPPDDGRDRLETPSPQQHRRLQAHPNGNAR
jgi:hypothetical protein